MLQDNIVITTEIGVSFYLFGKFFDRIDDGCVIFATEIVSYLLERPVKSCFSYDHEHLSGTRDLLWSLVWFEVGSREIVVGSDILHDSAEVKDRVGIEIGHLFEGDFILSIDLVTKCPEAVMHIFFGQWTTAELSLGEEDVKWSFKFSHISSDVFSDDMEEIVVDMLTFESEFGLEDSESGLEVGFFDITDESESETALEPGIDIVELSGCMVRRDDDLLASTMHFIEDVVEDLLCFFFVSEELDIVQEEDIYLSKLWEKLRKLIFSDC